jgi:putative dehydrogenase
MSVDVPATPPIVSLVAAGSMGARLGAFLVRRGVTVLTSVQGRSEATRSRAEQAGMRIVPHAALGSCEILLSIVPSDRAVEVAQSLIAAGAFDAHQPLYVDCNPVGPATTSTLANLLAAAGCPFVDAGIVGAQERSDTAPVYQILASGPYAERLRILEPYGIVPQIIEGPLGSASALRMCIAGTSKGLTALLAVMIAGAARAGVAKDLYREISRTHSALLAWVSAQSARLPATAARWRGEMEELTGWIEEIPDARIVSDIAAFYAQIATSETRASALAEALDDFFGRSSDSRARH